MSLVPEHFILSGTGMKLAGLLAGVESGKADAHGALEITSVVYSSGHVVPGSLFVAMRGEKTDGNRFISDAIERGAHAIVSELPRPPDPAWNAVARAASQTNEGRANALRAAGDTRRHNGFSHSEVLTAESRNVAVAAPPAQVQVLREVPAEVAWIQVPDARKALATIGANFYGHPADKLTLAGITGTNGKTTTSFLIDSVVRAAGKGTGLFGTIEYRTPVSKPSGDDNHARIAGPAMLPGRSRAGRRHARRARSQFARTGARPPVGLPFRIGCFHESHARPSRFSRNARKLFCRKEPLVSGHRVQACRRWAL